MSTKKQSSKARQSDPGQMKPEKEEAVEVKQLLKDERTHKIVGSFLLLTAVLLFIAFTSYLFTWADDQDKFSYRMLLANDIKVQNLLGTFGAFLSEIFIRRGFGVASYLLCSFFFVAGINLFLGKRVFSVWRNLKYVLLGLPFISLTGSVLFGNASGFNGRVFPWGGAAGDLMKDWLYKTVGEIGTIGILGLVFLAYVIWKFNPVFRLPKGKTKPAGPGDPVAPAAEEITEKVEWPVSDEISKSNSMKGDGGMALSTAAVNEPAKHDLTLVEKETLDDRPLSPQEKKDILSMPLDIGEEELGIPVQPSKPAIKNGAESLELEIKAPAEKAGEEPAAASGKQPVQKPYDPVLDLRDYQYPTLDLLNDHGNEKIVQDTQELENNKNQIINTLKNYDILIQKISATVGPTVTLYEIIPAAGVRISRIKNLEDDIALSLAALGIRIIAPIPGKGTIGIEVPNAKKTVVSMRTLLASEKFQKNTFSLPIAIGKKIDNENFIVDLTTMPHLLMAGATGQGKSVGLNAILVSLLYKKHPSQLKFVLVDPKKVELSIYKTIENHFLAKLPGEEDSIITDTKKVVHTLNALCIEMDNRYDLLKEAGCRNIREYNEKFAARKLNPEKGHQFLPFIVLVVDEFADLIMTAGKEIEMPIARLAQLARAVGIHLIIATQRPSVNIITGTIKANFPARIAFKVSSKIDSRTILDTGGAEQLIGKGDMLISYNGDLVRLQCAFVDTPEVDKVVDFISSQRGYPQPFLLPEYIDEKEMQG
jgi:DNA segregation ATPase FtsK/SpoIIIE, S-DNA-T family